MKVIWEGRVKRISDSSVVSIRLCLFDEEETPVGYPLPFSRHRVQHLPSIGIIDWCAADPFLINDLAPWDLLSCLGEASQAFKLSPPPPPVKRKAAKKAAPNALEVLTLSPAEKLVFDALEACPSFAGRIRDLPAFVAAALEAFPRVDILHEIKQAHFWIVSNKDAAPKSKFDRFLNSWLSRANERLGPPSSPAPGPAASDEAPPTPRKPTGSPIREEIKTLASRPFHGPKDARALASRIGSGMLASPADSDQENE